MNLPGIGMRTKWLALPLVLAVAMVPALVRADEPAKPAKPDEPAKPAEPTEQERVKALVENPRALYADEYDIRALKPAERLALGMYRYERDIKLLLKETLAGVKPTDMQKRTLTGIVDAQIEKLHETHGRPSRRFRPRPRAPGGELNAESPKDDSKDSKSGGAGPMPPGQLNRDRAISTSVYDDPTRLVNVLKHELSADQVKIFEPIALRWRMLRPFGVADGPLRQLMRAVRDPALKISDGTRAECSKLVQKEVMQLTRHHARLQIDHRLKAFDDAKAAVAAKLGADQRSHFESTLADLQVKFAREVMMIQDVRAKEKAAKEAEAKKPAFREQPKPAKP